MLYNNASHFTRRCQNIVRILLAEKLSRYLHGFYIYKLLWNVAKTRFIIKLINID